MHNKIKKVLVSILVLALMAPVGSIAANSEGEEEMDASVGEADAAVGETDAAEEETVPDEVDEDFKERTEEDALETMELAAENEKLEFYVCREVDESAQEKGVNPKEKGNVFAVKNKENGYIWWSSPINAMGDSNATNSLRRSLSSAVIITYGVPSDRTTKTLKSANKASAKITDIDGGVKVVYTFKDAGAKIPVIYTLEDDYLNVKVDVENIEENDISPATGKILTSISVFNSLGAAYSDEDGYFVIPDGSGAIINFNNNKKSTKSYSSKLYGSDTTAVPEKKPAVTENLYMPVYGIVKKDNAMVVVADKGDGNATLTASISGQSKSSYNICSYNFMLRGTESFIMNGEQSAFTVFENGKIKTENIELRFYPLSGDDLDYTDVAETYRNYLVNDQDIKPVSDPKASMYLNLYGGVEKQKSILGFPITLKSEITGFNQAKDIVSGLKDNGVDSMIVTYDNWTNAGIAGKIDYKAKPAGVLGGKSDFKDMEEYLSENNILLYPSVNNKSFASGQGYFTFRNTVAKVSGSYARIITYDRAFGVKSTFNDPKSLLSPSVFNEIYGKLTDNYSEYGLNGVSLGEMTSTLYGDYGKKGISRDETMSILEESFKNIQDNVGSILADTANAYSFKYVDYITNVPLSSSRFDVFDEDIPFYQLVMHGIKPYSTKAVNGSADYKTLMLKAIATGSNFNYDMIYKETNELKDTEYDIYYYANYDFWKDTAAKSFELSKAILDNVAGQKITDYGQDGDIITTVYENGDKTIVNLESGEINFNGTSYNLSDYIEEGAGAL